MNIFARLSEASTWASVAAALGSLGLNLDAGLWQTITLAGTGIAALLGVVIPEQGKK